MTNMIEKNMNWRASKPTLWLTLSVATASLMFGVCGLIYGRRTATTSQQSQNIMPANEIIVPNNGLLFRSEDGTPLLKIEKDSWGTHVRLLSASGASLIELNNLQGTGGIMVGSKAGGYAYIQAHEDSATITLIGKYNKEAVELTSATKDGSGSLSINEGTKGYQAVGIDAALNRLKSKGTITIPNENGPQWQAP